MKKGILRSGFITFDLLKYMKHFLISFDEKQSEVVPETALRALRGVTDVELVSTGDLDFSKISMPGPSLGEGAMEKLALEMETETDLLNETEALAYLRKLKSGWSKPLP